ncbi:MAG TPA: MATE family efflux transporter [Asticcacaulis sp.]|nr:MATE family efflux transporter [Asticcacaulis sp.]
MLRLRSQLAPETRAAFAALFRLSWPVIGSRVGVQVMALIDTVVVGRYSSAELGYLMLALSLFWVPAATSWGLSMGMQVKTAHFLGASDLHRIGAVFQRGITYALWLGFGFMALLLIVGIAFLDAIEKPEMAAGARLPMIIFALSMPPFLLSIAVSQFMEALSRTRDILIATFLVNALNIVLLLMLVPGKFTFFGIHFSGAMGAATATTVARLVQAAGLLIYVIRLKQVRPFDLLGRQEPDATGAVEQRHIGYATGAAYFIETAAFAGMAMFAGRIGDTAVASWAIILNFASVVFMVPMGISAGCSVLVGKAYGAGDWPEVARFGQVSFVSAAAFMAGVVVVVLLAVDPITRLYTLDPALIPMARHGLLLSCFFFIPDGLQVVAAQALRARKDVVAPTVIHYLSYGAIMLPLGFVFCLTFGWGVGGLVWAVVVASAISGPFQTGRFLWLDRKAES